MHIHAVHKKVFLGVALLIVAIISLTMIGRGRANVPTPFADGFNIQFVVPNFSNLDMNNLDQREIIKKIFDRGIIAMAVIKDGKTTFFSLSYTDTFFKIAESASISVDLDKINIARQNEKNRIVNHINVNAGTQYADLKALAGEFYPSEVWPNSTKLLSDSDFNDYATLFEADPLMHLGRDDFPFPGSILSLPLTISGFGGVDGLLNDIGGIDELLHKGFAVNLGSNTNSGSPFMMASISTAINVFEARSFPSLDSGNANFSPVQEKYFSELFAQVPMDAPSISRILDKGIVINAGYQEVGNQDTALDLPAIVFSGANAYLELTNATNTIGKIFSLGPNHFGFDCAQEHWTNPFLNLLPIILEKTPATSAEVIDHALDKAMVFAPGYTVTKDGWPTYYGGANALLMLMEGLNFLNINPIPVYNNSFTGEQENYFRDMFNQVFTNSINSTPIAILDSFLNKGFVIDTLANSDGRTDPGPLNIGILDQLLSTGTRLPFINPATTTNDMFLVGVGRYLFLIIGGEQFTKNRFSEADLGGAIIEQPVVCPPSDSTPPIISIISPTADDILTSGTVTVTAQADDAVGVTSVMINGTPATLTNGTALSGVWSATVNFANLPSPTNTAALQFFAEAKDAADNTGTAAIIKVDNDGISQVIDRDQATGTIDQSNIYSNEFSDISQSGTTFGKISSRGGKNVLVTKLASPAGVQASVSGSGTNAVTIDSCFYDYAGITDAGPERLFTKANGVTATLTCKNNVPTYGYKTSASTSNATGTSVALLKYSGSNFTGAIAKVTYPTTTSGTVYNGSPIFADPSNTEPVVWQIVATDGETVLGEGLLQPGDAKDIEFLGNPQNPTGVRITNLSNSLINTFTLDGETITLAKTGEPGDTFTDQCLGVPGNAGNTGCPGALLANVVLQKVYRGDTPTTRETTQATVKIFDKNIRQIPPANHYAYTYKNEAAAFVATCSANSICGLSTTGDYYAIAEYINPSPSNLPVYDLKQVKFDTTGVGSAELLFINNYDKDGNFIDSVGTNPNQSISMSTNAQKKPSTLWHAAKKVLGANASNSQVANLIKQVAKQNSISIPEWNIAGNINSRSLKASVIESLFR